MRTINTERSLFMGHGHHHHHHEDMPQAAGDVPAVLDASIPDSELSPADVSRRGFLRRAGLLGAAAAAGGALANAGIAHAHGDDDDQGGFDGFDRHGHGRPVRQNYKWLAGDHHIHTQYSSDAMYRVVDNVKHASAYGLDWMVITDHGSVNHAKIGVEKVNPQIREAREDFKDMLVFQGLEWNIPAAEHGTVFVHPGANEVAVLKEFENTFDGSVVGAVNPANVTEALAIAGVKFLGEQITKRRIQDALFLANHPARNGIDSPHEIRGWRDANPKIAIGFEGAPGHQAAGIPVPNGGGSARGFYGNSPNANSFPGYPLESYRTWGGFDWMTSTVGGLWDSLLAEGKSWSITANSDSHVVYGETSKRPADTDFNKNGFHSDPVYGQPTSLTPGDFWPGYYSRTHVGARNFGYAAVMEGLRAGRVWVDHGGLISGLDVTVRPKGSPFGVTLGDSLVVRRGQGVELVIKIQLANTPNWANFIPTLARVDVIRGAVTGEVSDKDSFKAPDTKVVKSFEVNKSTGEVSFTYDLGAVDQAFYVRVRGTDGNRTAPGYLGAAIDPAGPAIDVLGDADPWKDLWFYANPIWVYGK
ncbi:PHP domain-containing protein [Dactylosporangium sp. AC04546]|uniref:PHP domain-containing protein n=1 Tax=Dactylosporangium sp. AC04546 TaxID=2862460 RepID=UPI001EDFD920|nr:PHP domain-containing protein [Dactylosporangium sp. AC04546]WVK82545.1 PHP domain-containing protein [Dactylosporangium sp. AC04546]